MDRKHLHRKPRIRAPQAALIDKRIRPCATPLAVGPVFIKPDFGLMNKSNHHRGKLRRGASASWMIHNGLDAVLFPGDGIEGMASMGNAIRITILCTSLLAACSTVKPHATEGYRDGYITGCSSGQVYAGKSGPEAPRDYTRYGTDAEYTQGWNEGQEECYTQAMASPRNWGGTGGR